MRDKRTGVREVRERFGVEPRRADRHPGADGRSIDNVKGVPGVGEKTATALIQQFGSLDNLYAVSPRWRNRRRFAARKKSTADRRGIARTSMLSRKLVTNRCDVPLELGPERFRLGYHRRESAFAELMRELEIHLAAAGTDAPAELPMSRCGAVTGESPDIERSSPRSKSACEPRSTSPPRLAASACAFGARRTIRRVFYLRPPPDRQMRDSVRTDPAQEACHDKTHLSRLRTASDRCARRRFRHDDRRLPDQSGKPEPPSATLS